MKPATIALLMQDFTGGGAERMMVNLAEGLASRGHEVELVAVRLRGPLLSRVPPTVPVIALGTRRVSRSIPALARYFRTRRPDAALATLVHMNVAAVLARGLARTSTRLVLREANRIRANAVAVPPPIRLAYRLLPWFYPRADHVIAVSEAVADEVRALTRPPYHHVTTVPNPVLSTNDLVTIMSPQPAPHPWLEHQDVPVILSVGSLTLQKNHATLIDAFARLRHDRSARLVILGDGPLRHDLLNRAHRLGVADDFLLPGFSSCPFAWMKHSDLLAHTARWEGAPNVIVEALACGLPVVATDCPSGPREILANGRYGVLVPEGDVTAVTAGMAASLDNPPSAEPLRARASEFTVEAVLPKYEAILLGQSATQQANEHAG